MGANGYPRRTSIARCPRSHVPCCSARRADVFVFSKKAARHRRRLPWDEPDSARPRVAHDARNRREDMHRVCSVSAAGVDIHCKTALRCAPQFVPARHAFAPRASGTPAEHGAVMCPDVRQVRPRIVPTRPRTLTSALRVHAHGRSRTWGRVSRNGARVLRPDDNPSWPLPDLPAMLLAAPSTMPSVVHRHVVRAAS